MQLGKIQFRKIRKTARKTNPKGFFSPPQRSLKNTWCANECRGCLWWVGFLLLVRFIPKEGTISGVGGQEVCDPL